MGVSSGAFETSVCNAADDSVRQYPNRIRIEWSSSQNIENNTSTISWTIKAAGGTGGYVMTGPVTVKLAGTTVYSKTDRFEMWYGATLGSGTFTLTHSTDGTQKLTGWAEAAIYTYAISSTNHSYSVDLPTIPRASKISVTGGNKTLGSPLVISISKASSSFTHTLGWQFGSQWGIITEKTTNSSVTWTPPLSLTSEIPNENSGTMKITCTTYSGGSIVGSSQISVSLSVPSGGSSAAISFTPSIARTTPAGCGLYVKNHSAVRWDVTASGAYDSTITKCEITGPNLSYTSTTSSNSYSATSSTLTTCGTMTYTAKITDSRGNTTTQYGTIYVEDYNPPVITSINSFRSDSNGNLNSSGQYVTHKIDSSFYTLGGKNNVTITVSRKESSSSTYTNPVTIKNDATNQTSYTYTYPTSSFSLDTTYDFQIRISDSVGEWSTTYSHIGTKNIPINLSSDNNSVAIGGFAQPSNIGRFDCAWEAHFATAPITDSDRNLKYNIEDINIDIIDKLRPVQYNLINGQPDVTHYGFIAQDVEQALIESGVANDKMGIVYYDEDNETKERTNYALSYDEIIPLLVKKCQELQQEIDRLKGE